VGVDPIVEEALRRRPVSGEAARPRHGQEGHTGLRSGDGGLGWPGEPADGTGLGWPADLLGVQPAGAQTPAVEEPPVPPRGGWRRILGGRAA